jgi:hypothetical protein
VMADEFPKRLELLYADAVENLKFLKQQQWVITRYTLTAYAALFAIATQTPVRIALILATWLVAIGATFFLHHFIRSLRKFRKRIKWIYESNFPADEHDPLMLTEDKDWLNKKGFVRVLIGVCLGGAAITTWAILCLDRTGCPLCQ